MSESSALAELHSEACEVVVIEPAHGWIQWKGTTVCMDVHCECGAHTHLDADFAYFIRCTVCKIVYRTGDRVALTRVTEDEIVGDCVEETMP